MEKKHIEMEAVVVPECHGSRGEIGNQGMISAFDDNTHQNHGSAARRSYRVVVRISLALLVSNSLSLRGAVPKSVQRTEQEKILLLSC